MNQKDKDYESRKQLRLEKLGSEHPVCALCGEDDWECLELHHLEGKAYGNTMAIVCRNCHRKLSVKQDSHPKPTPSFEASLGRLLLGLADFFTMLAKTLARYGEELLQKVKNTPENTGGAQ